jgi:hypothetical protein
VVNIKGEIFLIVVRHHAYISADIKGRHLPNVGILKEFDKFHVVFVIDGQFKHKTGTAKGKGASWTESFYL